MNVYSDSIAIAIEKPDIPQQVFSGAKDLIRRLSEEEMKIEEAEHKMLDAKKVVNLHRIPYECIASIVMKYGNRDIYKDVYKFIK